MCEQTIQEGSAVWVLGDAAREKAQRVGPASPATDALYKLKLQEHWCSSLLIS
jgi:hypothetical protein